MDKAARYSEGEKVTWIGVAANAILSVVKLAAGIFGKSDALIADAVHSLSDLFTDFVVLVSLKISRRPVDELRPYGYGRVETVGTGLLGVFLIIVGAGIFWDAIKMINIGVDYIPTTAALAGAVVSIIVKEGMYQYTVRVGKRIGSSPIVANAWHHRSDALSSVASFIGIGAAMMGWPLFDPLAAILVTALIVKVGWEISRDSFMDIIDTAVKKEIRERIIGEATGTPGVIDYHDLKTRKIGSDILVDIHIEVNPWMNVAEAHRIADDVRDSIMKKVENIADVLVHIDPEGEPNGIVYSTPREEIIKVIDEAATSAEGVIDCRDIMIHYVGNDIIVNLTIRLSTDLSIKEGYAKVMEVKKKVLEIDRVVDAVISVELPSVVSTVN